MDNLARGHQLANNIRLVEDDAPEADCASKERQSVSQLRPALAPVVLHSGAMLEIDQAREYLTLRGVGGDIQLRIRSTAEGLVLSLAACALEVIETQTLRVSVDKLQLEARRGIEVNTHGSIAQHVTGDITTHCEGALRFESGSAHVITHTGELSLDSTHDVSVKGDRIFINC